MKTKKGPFPEKGEVTCGKGLQNTHFSKYRIKNNVIILNTEQDIIMENFSVVDTLVMI